MGVVSKKSNCPSDFAGDKSGEGPSMVKRTGTTVLALAVTAGVREKVRHAFQAPLLKPTRERPSIVWALIIRPINVEVGAASQPPPSSGSTRKVNFGFLISPDMLAGIKWGSKAEPPSTPSFWVN